MDAWRATEDFVLLTGNLAVVLRRVDPLRLGAPEDEYDVEAGQLARLLLASPPLGRADVEAVVDEVFERYGFKRPDADSYSSLIDGVWHEYDALRSGS